MLLLGALALGFRVIGGALVVLQFGEAVGRRGLGRGGALMLRGLAPDGPLSGDIFDYLHDEDLENVVSVDFGVWIELLAPR